MRTLARILTARVLAGCSLEAATPAAPAPTAAKAPEFPPDLIREDGAGIKARCASGVAGDVSAAEVVLRGKSPSGAIMGIDRSGFAPAPKPRGSAAPAAARTLPLG